MLDQCEKLKRVRNAHLQKSLTDLSGKIKLRNGIDDEIDQISTALRQLADQRASWDNQWQEWIHQGGALRRGQEYASQHMKIAALEKDLAEEQATALERREQVQQEVDAARVKATKQREALSQISDVAERMRQQERLGNDTRESQRAEDAASIAWFLARKATMENAV